MDKRKLKFISIASAIVMCSTMSSSIHKANASPRSFFNRAWNGFRGIFTSSSRGSANITTDTTGNSTFTRNGPGRNPVRRDRGGLGGARKFTTSTEGKNSEPLQVPRVDRDYHSDFGENPQAILNGLHQKENKDAGGVTGPTKYAKKR